MKPTSSKRKAQFSIEAIFYLLALATLLITFIFLFSSTADKISSRQALPAMRLAGTYGDLLVLNPEEGFATREANHAKSHLCTSVEDVRLSENTTYCVTRACWDDGLKLFKVCA